jgi:hypothetical protein
MSLHSVKAALEDVRLADLPFAEAVVQVFRQRAKDRQWRAATLARELCNFAGAMGSLELYSSSPVSFRMGDSSAYADAIKSAQQLANEEMVNSQPATTAEEMLTAVELAPDVATRTALAMCWCTAGRMGDTLKLQRRDVKLDEDFLHNGKFLVTWVRGKGSLLGTPYTTPSVCLEEWRAMMFRYINTAGPNAWLWPGGTRTFGALTNLALRTANPQCTVRAIRRGSLQAMATAGVKDETLLLFSGHRSIDMLQKYLNYSVSSAARSNSAFAAAANLVRRPPPPSPRSA